MKVFPLQADGAGRDAWLIGLLSLMLALLLRASGFLQSIELTVLDWRIQMQQSGTARHVMLVLETEQDIQRHGHPVPDGILAESITRLLDAGAALVAVDKFRDLPVAPGTQRLNELLQRDERIVWVSRFGVAQGKGVLPPAVLRETDRTGCADLSPDLDGVNRRALLAQEAAGESCLALSLTAVAHALMRAGKDVQFIDEERLKLGVVELTRLSASSGFQRFSELGGFQIALAHPVREVPALSLQQVLDNEAQWVRGRVVFLGTSAVSLGDRHLVPDSRGSEARHIPGVEVHARMAEELLRVANGEAVPMRYIALVPLLLIMIGFAMIGAWAGVRSASLRRGLLVGLAVSLAYGLAVLQLDRMHWRLECLPPLTAGILALSLGWARRAQTEMRDRAQLRDLFNRQVAPEVAEAIWRQRESFFSHGRVLPVEVRVTVIFADLRGFTSITEQLDRERMVHWLNAAVGQMTQAVMAAGGVVTRFGGDQIMAVFGVPVPRLTEAEQREDAASAVRAALNMRDRLAALNLSLAAEGLPAARVRIGVQSGTALQCGVGSRDRFEFTVLGDAVNTASRLESLPGEDDGSAARIFAGSQVITLCGDLFSHEHVAELKLKGKDIPVDVYRINGESA